jgi:hypothetical protein
MGVEVGNVYIYVAYVRQAILQISKGYLKRRAGAEQVLVEMLMFGNYDGN